MRTIKYAGLVVVLSLLACGRKTASSSWDSITGTYTIPELEISYTIPSAVENWAIANIDGLVPEIKFCGVDNSTDVCIVIVEPESAIKCVEELDSTKVRTILHEIIGQSPSGRILQFNPILQRGRYADSDSWGFKADISIANDADTAFVSYSGYLFDCRNQKVAGIVSVAPTEVFASAEADVLESYFAGLNHLERN